MDMQSTSKLLSPFFSKLLSQTDLYNYLNVLTKDYENLISYAAKTSEMAQEMLQKKKTVGELYWQSSRGSRVVSEMITYHKYSQPAENQNDNQRPSWMIKANEILSINSRSNNLAAIIKKYEDENFKIRRLIHKGRDALRNAAQENENSPIAQDIIQPIVDAHVEIAGRIIKFFRKQIDNKAA